MLTRASHSELSAASPRSLSPPAEVSRRPSGQDLFWYLGPAFVASVAYMDPGNFATNIEGGARFGYDLLWVLLWSNAVAILVQYLAAKLGIASGKTLPQNCRAHFSRPTSLGLWVAAEVSAMATDLAEFLGAALGFYLLFGLPMLPAALLTAVAVFLILLVEQAGFRQLEKVIMAFVAVIGVAYAVELFLGPPDWGAVARHMLVPRVNSESIYLAVGMLGATVMPHVIYLHSALVLHRREANDLHDHTHRRRELADVLLAMNGAWLVNSAMVVMAAAVFFGRGAPVHSIEQAHHTLVPLLGPLAGGAFALALLCSGLSSSAVGTLAGQVILEGFLNLRMSIFLRRLITMAPALAVVAWGLDPLKILILSQVVLSFCLPFALVPLILLTGRRDVMGSHANRPHTNLLAWASTAGILGLNIMLLYHTWRGRF